MGKIYRQVRKECRYGNAIYVMNYKKITPEKMAEIENAMDKLA